MSLYMDKFLELKKNYLKNEDGLGIRALYNFVDELLKNKSKDNLEILFLVYKLLNLHYSAYKVYLELYQDSEDKNHTEQRIKLKELANSLGDQYALMYPQTKEDLEREQYNLHEVLKLPLFKYHRNPLKTNAFKYYEDSVVCDCCNKETQYAYTGPFYSLNEIEYLCPLCIKNGKAALKFAGEFQDASSTDEVCDENKIDELIHRTPGYRGWQQEYWKAHCNDFCSFIGYVGYKELKDLGIVDDVICDDFVEDLENLQNGGSYQGYLFQCLHCNKYLLHVDCD